ENQTGTDVKESTGKRKGIHVVVINNLDGESHLRIRVADQILSQTIYILGDNQIVNHLGLGFDLLRNLFAQSNLLLKAIPIAHSLGATHVTIADGDRKSVV